MYGAYGNSVLDPAELDSAAMSRQGSVLEIRGLGRLDWRLPILIDDGNALCLVGVRPAVHEVAQSHCASDCAHLIWGLATRAIMRHAP